MYRSTVAVVAVALAVSVVFSAARAAEAQTSQPAQKVIGDMSLVKFAPGEKEDPADKSKKISIGTAEVVDGKFGKAVKFTFADKFGLGFFTSNIRADEDWNEYEGISFWVKGDGSKSFGGIQLLNRDYDQRFAYCFPIDSKEWVKVTIPWGDLVPEIATARCGTDGKDDFRPAQFGGLFFGKWWYWREYPGHSYTIDNICLEKKIEVDKTDYTPKSAGTPNLLAKLKDKKPVTVVTMGDSLTDPRHWSNRKKVWPDELVKALKEKYGSEVKLVNPAMGGTTLSQNLVVMPRWLAETPTPDVVTILFGGNDHDTKVTGKRYKEYLSYAVDRIRRDTKGKTEIIIMTTAPGFERWETYKELEDAAREVAAQKKTGLVDVAAECRKTGSADAALKAGFWVNENNDRTHLGAGGHDLIKDAVLKAIGGADEKQAPASK